SGGKRARGSAGNGLLGGLLSGSSGKHPAAPAPMPPAAPVASPVQVNAHPATLGQATGRQAAVNPAANAPAANGARVNVAPAGQAKQVIRSTGKQAAAAAANPPTLAPQNTAAVAAVGAAGRGAIGVAAPNSGRNRQGANGARASGKQPAVAASSVVAVATTQSQSGAWLKFGATPLGFLGKSVLALSAIEVLWGATTIGLVSLAIYENGRTPSASHLLESGAVLLAIVLVFCLLGGQAISRPIYRRGAIGKWKRRFQGLGLLFVLVVAHALAIWGTTVFGFSTGANTYALTTYLIFGLVVLIAGALSTMNTLG
ncbi:MAG TPA: hypothetical protein VKQ36_11715, partial [Ktedonobacterales bacterium]|nr:hypothetical protein [Ktedonobacterales bacterium]